MALNYCDSNDDSLNLEVDVGRLFYFLSHHETFFSPNQVERSSAITETPTVTATAATPKLNHSTLRVFGFA